MAIVSYHNSSYGFWFRVFGYGLCFYKQAKFSDIIFKRRKYFGFYIELLQP